MPKKTTKQKIKPTEQNTPARETKILNVICNTSLLLMSAVTEAFSERFTKLSKEMITAITTSLGNSEDATKDIHKKTDSLQKELPQQIREQLLAMKTDITTQLQEKKEKLGPLLADPIFDDGITIVERYKFGLPALTQDLDERSLLGYIALLRANDPRFTTMFQELLEWMKNLPHP
ncbi:MAG: hypothetical protein NTZ75_07905 [Euryarchaeota archaeon]|nr:hypothetical protein [Euryarchaeota archaeon]